jgi:hypothetical protein
MFPKLGKEMRVGIKLASKWINEALAESLPPQMYNNRLVPLKDYVRNTWRS